MYYFGNLCQVNPPLLASLNISVATCEVVNNGSLKQGFSSFFRYGQKVAQSYLNG